MLGDSDTQCPHDRCSMKLQERKHARQQQLLKELDIASKYREGEEKGGVSGEAKKVITGAKSAFLTLGTK